MWTLIVFAINVLITVTSSFAFIGVGEQLAFQYDEPGLYNPSTSGSRHGVGKRDLRRPSEPFTLHITSRNRDYSLVLKKDDSVFHAELKVKNSDGPMEFNTDNVFVGNLEGQPGSLAFGTISSTNHQFDGTIFTESGLQLYVESTQHYTPSNDTRLSPGIIYEPADITWENKPPPRKNRELPDDSLLLASTVRVGRQKTVTKYKRICTLYVQIEHAVVHHYGSGEDAINMFVRQLQHVNKIYKDIDFNGDGTADDVRFLIKGILVESKNNTRHRGCTCNCTGWTEALDLLEAFSEEDHSEYCLAILVTMQNFEDGELGRAYTGSLLTPGGICQKRSKCDNVFKSYNTIVITLSKEGKIVPQQIVLTSLLHEIVHTFGAPHDPDDESDCSPMGRDGNYLMYRLPATGNPENEHRLSKCSLHKILPVLNAKGWGSEGCFEESSIRTTQHEKKKPTGIWKTIKTILGVAKGLEMTGQELCGPLCKGL